MSGLDVGPKQPDASACNPETLAEDACGLGIRRGTALFVHSSIKAVGRGARAEWLIAALRTAVGDEGTLAFPTFTARTEEYFDSDHTPSVMGAVAETFRKTPGVLRSRHPRHSVAAMGPAASFLIEGHEHTIGPCGVGTPFDKHAQMGGQILLIGVDLDTFTLLHTAEAMLDLPYLQTLKGRYIDDQGQVRTITMRQAPGGHRGGVRGFERVFLQRGLMRRGQLGNARTMLLDARSVLQTMIELLRQNPAAALAPDDHYPDDVDFKARIRAAQLAELGARISIVLPRTPDDPKLFARMLERFGCPPRFGVHDDLPFVPLARGADPPPPTEQGQPPDRPRVLQPAPEDLIRYTSVPAGYQGLAHAPLEAARAGIQPFYGVLYKSKCRDLITDIIVEDGLTDLPGILSPPLEHLSRLVPHGRVALGEGHAQLREILSALRMRNFTGQYHLVVPEGENLYAQTWEQLEQFWSLFP